MNLGSFDLSTRRRFWIGVAALILSVNFASETRAEVPVPFDNSWREQGFLRLFTNDYSLRGYQLDVLSDGTVSLLWRAANDAMHGASSAEWVWRVREGVIPTDLTAKGNDDRNLSIYFVFVDSDRLEALKGRSARRILREDSARALIYVWGGEHKVGSMLPSPYSPRLRTKVLRSVEPGQFRESVDLESDYRTAFGKAPGVLVGLAVSADSDDTNGRIIASIGDLVLN